MAVKAVHVSDVPHPNLDHQLIPAENAVYQKEEEEETKVENCYRFPKFVVMGHRGSGMNMLQSSDPRMKSIKENTLLSFNSASNLPLDFIEFDVQVFFLTNGGSEIYTDIRRNSLDEAIKVCKEGGLQGIVSEVRAVFRNPGAISKIKEAKLCLVTYGQLNNVGEVVYMQHLMGVEGVIVDLVGEITKAVAAEEEDCKDKRVDHDQIRMFQLKTEAPQFSRDELSFLLNLIPQLMV
ncbi:Glycerophosphodiester phosphodiesterase GDPD1, chloroplastic [Linum grandiflorum]